MKTFLNKLISDTMTTLNIFYNYVKELYMWLLLITFTFLNVKVINNEDSNCIVHAIINLCKRIPFVKNRFVDKCVCFNDNIDINDNTDINDMINKDIVQPLIIGITGRKRSGKDTIGNYLVENCGFVRVAYADALKEACIQIFGFSNDQVYGDELKEVIDEDWGHTPRELLQKVGTELFRDTLPKLCKNISNDIWIKSVKRKIKNLSKQGYNKFVITDVRFQNELDFIKESKGVTWKVTRGFIPDSSLSPLHEPALLPPTQLSPIINDIKDKSTCREDLTNVPIHQSEALIDNFECDYIFTNNDTIENLYHKVKQDAGLDILLDNIL
jgi:hypothetical protein